MSVIMGLDPSMRSTGVTVWDSDTKCHKYYVVAAHPTKKLLKFVHPQFSVLPYEPVPVKDKTSIGKEDAITSNIEMVCNLCKKIMLAHQPEYIVIESCAFGAAGRVADLSGLNHCLRLTARSLNIPIYAVPPTTNKMEFTGNGQATKEMMVESWKACDPVAVELCGLHKLDDIADSYALCHFPKSRLVLA